MAQIKEPENLKFKCHNCDKLYTKYELEIHFVGCQKIDIKAEGQTEREVNVCEFCDEIFKDAPSLTKHVKEEHKF